MIMMIIIDLHKRSTRLSMIEWGRKFIWNCERDEISTILTNGMCTNCNLSKKMRRIKFSGILKYKWIT